MLNDYEITRVQKENKYDIKDMSIKNENVLKKDKLKHRSNQSIQHGAFVFEGIADKKRV